MKKNIKKATVFLTAGVLSLSLLAGCTPPAVPEDTAPPASQAQEEDTAQMVTLTAVIKDMSADDPVSQELLEKVSAGVSELTGQPVQIVLAPISDGTYSESMGLLLQSGEIPDLMYFQGGDYQFAITQGILEDLSSYIEASVNVKAMMQPFNEKRIEYYPYLVWLAADRIKVPVVRQDWLAEMESGQALLENPTPEQYKQFFQELKGKKGLQAAYTVQGDISELDTVFNLAFGIDKTWMEEDSAYVYSKVSAAQKEKLAFYAELYRDGLLDNEWLSKKWDTKESAFYNGEVGVVAGTAGSVINIYNSKMVNQNGAAAALTVLPPAKGMFQGYTPSDVSKESRGWAISAYSEHKDLAFAVLEYMAGEEGQLLDKLGYEDEHYTVADGVYTLTDKTTEWYPRFHESIAVFDVEFAAETPYFSPAAVDSLAAIEQYASLDCSFILPEEYVTNWDAGEALVAEYTADIISGRKSIDTFDDFAKEWNALGGDLITAYANEILP